MAGKNNGGYKYGGIAKNRQIFTKKIVNLPNFTCHIAKSYPIFFPSTVSVSSTLIVVILVRQFQPNYLIFRKKLPRYGQNT